MFTKSLFIENFSTHNGVKNFSAQNVVFGDGHDVFREDDYVGELT